MENKLIAAAMHDRKVFNDLVKFRTKSTFSDVAKIVFEAITEYYKRDSSANKVDVDIISSSLEREHPRHKDLLLSFIGDLPDPSIPNIRKAISDQHKESLRERILAASTSSNNDAEFVKLLDEYREVDAIESEEEQPDVFVARPVMDIVRRVSADAKIKFSLEALNDVTSGGLLRGHHVLVFARPDAGKTTFAIELVYGFLKQGLKTMYIGNEDPAEDVLIRMLSRIVRKPKSAIEQHPDKAQHLAMKRNYDKLIFVEMYPGTPAEIEQAVKEHRPDVLIVDQARNIKLNRDNRVLVLEEVERFLRELGKKYGMVTVSFTQAGESGENKLVLGMSDVDFSNTGMQGAADLMIGIGVNREYYQMNKRMLSFPKNKLSSDKEPRQVYIDHRINRIHT